MSSFQAATLGLALEPTIDPDKIVKEDAVPPDVVAYDYATSLKLSQAAIGRTVRDRVFIDPAGKQVRLADLLGKPIVISMIYTSCYQICSMTTRNLAKVAEKARAALGHNAFRILTIGFDTRFDTPENMLHFARQQGVDEVNWLFLSIDSEGLAELIEDLGFVYFRSPKGYDHLVQATILDGKGQIYRQVYGEVYDAPQLTEPLKQLILGTPQPDHTVLEDLVRRVRFFCTVYDPFRDAYRFDYSLFLGILISGSIILAGFFILYREFRNRPNKA